jgi:hypothetical protein
MINIMRHQTIDKLRNVEQTKDSEEHEDNLTFTFFNDPDGSTVDVGIGTEIDPTLRHLPIVDPDPSTPSDPAEPAHEDTAPQPEPDQPTSVDQPSSVLQAPHNPEEQVPQDEIKPNFGLIIAAAEQSDNPEPDSSSVDDFKEKISKSAKLFEETRFHMSSRNIIINHSTHSTHSSELMGFLDIEEESVESAPLPIDNLEKLDEEYTKPKDNVGGLIIDGKLAATDKSSSKSSEPWAVRVFIVAPIKRLFHVLYNDGVKGISKFIGLIFLILLLSGIATVFYNAHTTGQPPLEIALQLYSDAKEFVRVVYKDISSAIRGN